MGYKRDTINGISWLSLSRIFIRGFSFIRTIVLARILSPEQFGIFAIASLVLALLELLTETGINTVLIQSKKNIEEYINSAWVVSIIRGSFISLLILLLTPIIINFFNVKDAFQVLIIISLVPFIRGFINPAEIKFQKELSFFSEFWFRTSVFLVDALLTMILVVLTHSVNSLAYGIVAGACLEVILSFLLIKPKPILEIKKEYFKELFHKGKWITGYGVFNYIAQQADNITVGKVLGSSSLGIYQIAYSIALLPASEISDVVSRVVFPVFTKISDDRKRLFNAFIKTEILVLTGSILLGVIIWTFTREIILILGSQWMPAIPVLRILSIYGVLRTISGPASALFLSVEKQWYVTTMTFVRFMGLLLTIYPFVLKFGLIGAGYSALISAIVEIPVILYFSNKILFKKGK